MNSTPINSIRDLASVIRGRRRELGLSQAELAERLGVSRQWIVGFEAGNPGAALLSSPAFSTRSTFASR